MRGDYDESVATYYEIKIITIVSIVIFFHMSHYYTSAF
jgi:hypothetical protein